MLARKCKGRLHHHRADLKFRSQGVSQAKLRAKIRKAAERSPPVQKCKRLAEHIQQPSLCGKLREWHAKRNKRGYYKHRSL
jgi:hypothetical protein